MHYLFLYVLFDGRFQKEKLNEAGLVAAQETLELFNADGSLIELEYITKASKVSSKSAYGNEGPDKVRAFAH